MTASAREDILKRLRARPTGSAVPAEPDFDVVRGRDWSTEEKIERLTAQLNSVNGEVYRLKEADLADAVLDRLARSDARTLLLGRNSVYRDALSARQPNSLTLLAYDRDIESWRETLFHEVDAALTTTRGAIAETGSLILWPTPEEPRLMSLVPPLHIAVVSTRALYSTFSEAIAEQRWSAGMPTNALLVSGPSKTADIEQTLVYGAHGPRELVVFLVP